MKNLKNYLIILLVAFIGNTIWAQADKSLDDQLPIDSKVKTGTLDNGMKYYVLENHKPENRAELTLVINAGSVLEDDDQQGLAHMTEHMCFNGTKHFKKHELVEYLESIGMKFGADLNAYTSFDQTVYGITVPLDKEEYMDKGLLVLSDWASEVSFEDEEIDKERGVIEEEWRLGQGAQDRMMRKYLPVMLKGSKYAKRLPIGKMEIIRNGPHENLRRFYKDWYRADLMAIIAVGDFDAEKIEKKVKDLFSQIQPVENPRERTYFDVPNHEETYYVVATDKEAQQTMLQMSWMHPQFAMKNIRDYRQSIVNQIYNKMINDRLQELTVQEDPPFMFAYSGYGGFLGPKDAYTAMAMMKAEKVQDALTAVIQENERVKKFGFTASELERAKKSVLRSIEKTYSERNNRESNSYVQEFVRNFLKPHDPIPGIEYEYNLYKEYVPGIELSEVNALATKWISDENRVIMLMGPERDDVKLPDEEELRTMVESVNTSDLMAYADKVSDKPFFDKTVVPGKVDKKKKNKKMKFETWTMSNGAKVVVMPTEFKQDQILFKAFSMGGWSLYDLKDDLSAKNACDIIEESGIGNYDKIELDKYLSDKVVRLSPYINEVSEGFTGSTSPQDLETFLQLLYLYFTQPRKDQSAFNSYINKMRGFLENNNSPESAFRDTIMGVTYQHNKRMRTMKMEMLDEIDYKRANYIFRQRFGDPSNFTFYFVGNINTKDDKALIEKYIGGLPMVKREETFRNLNIEKPQGMTKAMVRKGTEPKSIVYMNYYNKFSYTFDEIMNIDLLCKVLTTRLLDTIREDESGVYSIGAYPGFTKYPVPEYQVNISFGCAPKNAKKIISGVEEQVKKLVTEGPTSDEVATAVKKKLRERETSKETNRYWLNKLVSVDYQGMDLKYYYEFEPFLNKVSPESLKAAANKFLAKNNQIRVVLMPEKVEKAEKKKKEELVPVEDEPEEINEK